MKTQILALAVAVAAWLPHHGNPHKTGIVPIGPEPEPVTVTQYRLTVQSADRPDGTWVDGTNILVSVTNAPAQQFWRLKIEEVKP